MLDQDHALERVRMRFEWRIAVVEFFVSALRLVALREGRLQHA